MIIDELERMYQQAEMAIGFKKTDDAIALLRSREAPNDVRSSSMLARAYYQRGDTRGDMYSANFFAKRALALGSDDPRLPAIVAVSAFRKEQYAEANEYFARYVTDSSGAATQFTYGLSLLDGGRAADAVPWLERAAKLDSRNEDVQKAL